MLTLQQIKDSLPKYRLLTPGMDVWREGDEYCLTETVKLAKPGWQKIGSGAVGLELPTKDCEMHGGWFIVETVIGIGVRIASDYVARRPIPDEVLENQAFWILLHRLSPMPILWSKGGEPYAMHTHHNWLEPEQVEALGGEINCKKQTEAGDLYSKWLGEQLT